MTESVAHRSGSAWRRWTWISMALFFVVTLLSGLSRHWGFMTSINDLGTVDQAVWGTLNGKPFLNTSVFGTPINWLGAHFHAVFLLFVPLYAIASGPEWFVLAQAFALTLAAWPIFLLASKACQSEKAGMLWALAYLANPFILGAAAWDFLPVMLAVPLMASGMLAVENADRHLLLLSCMPMFLIQEHFGLTVAGFGLLWGARHKDWRLASCLVFFGVGHAIVVVGYIIPSLSPTGGHVMLSSDLGQLSRYGWLGNSPSEILNNLVAHPIAVAEVLMRHLGAPYYILGLLLPFLGLPIIGGVALLPGLSYFAINLLSANPMLRDLVSYHNACLVPVLATAAIHGANRASSFVKRYSAIELACFSLFANLVAGYMLAPFPLPGARNIWAPNHVFTLPDPGLTELQTVLRKEWSLSVQGNVASHFSQRNEIYTYPQKVGDVDAVVLRLHSPTRKLYPDDPAVIGSLASHLQMPIGAFLSSVECILADKKYGVLYWNEPWLVLAKDTNSSLPKWNILLRLDELRTQWLPSGPDSAGVSTKTCE